MSGYHCPVASEQINHLCLCEPYSVFLNTNFELGGFIIRLIDNYFSFIHLIVRIQIGFRVEKS